MSPSRSMSVRSWPRKRAQTNGRWRPAFAHRMLPQIFRPDHPVFEVQLPREYRLKLERLGRGSAGRGVFGNRCLGWVYQFWQSKKKEEINRSEVKIGADELPAVTQLFTEPYMVEFLLHNSLGAWWVSRQPRPGLSGRSERTCAELNDEAASGRRV